jgi:transcriptional regulator with XRE-family HTH domain
MISRPNLVKARGNISQAELGEKVGASQQTVSHWETGRATPPISKMLKLEKLLGMPKEQLFPDVFNSETELTPTGTEGR